MDLHFKLHKLIFSEGTVPYSPKAATFIGEGHGKRCFLTSCLNPLWRHENIFLFSKQGLEGYFRDPGFDQNTVRDSGKRKIFWRDSGIDYIPGSGIEKNLGTGRGNSCPIVGNSGNFHRLDEHNDRESESNRRVLTGKSLLLKNKNKQLSSVTS